MNRQRDPSDRPPYSTSESQCIMHNDAINHSQHSMNLAQYWVISPSLIIYQALTTKKQRRERSNWERSMSISGFSTIRLAERDLMIHLKFKETEGTEKRRFTVECIINKKNLYRWSIKNIRLMTSTQNINEWETWQSSSATFPILSNMAQWADSK